MAVRTLPHWLATFLKHTFILQLNEFALVLLPANSYNVNTEFIAG